MRELRARADAILIGATNLRVDDPGLSLSPEERERRRAAGQPLPARIVVTSRGDGIRPDAKIFDRAIGGPAYVVHTANMPEAARAQLAPVATLVEMDATSVPMRKLLTWMRKPIGAQVVMCEGGGDLVAQLFAARAVDELYVTVVPRILGGVDAPTLAGGAGFDPDAMPDATLTSLERQGDELFQIRLSLVVARTGIATHLGATQGNRRCVRRVASLLLYVFVLAVLNKRVPEKRKV